MESRGHGLSEKDDHCLVSTDGSPVITAVRMVAGAFGVSGVWVSDLHSAIASQTTWV